MMKIIIDLLISFVLGGIGGAIACLVIWLQIVITTRKKP